MKVLGKIKQKQPTSSSESLKSGLLSPVASSAVDIPEFYKCIAVLGMLQTFKLCKIVLFRLIIRV